MPLAHLHKVDELDSCLPQLQCGLCGYGGCRPYAQAMALEGALPNRCPPGGDSVLATLQAIGAWPQLQGANQLQRLASDCEPAPSAGIASIDEQWCIGCTKCIAVCPVDAIIGANKKMHTVLQSACTGCDLCLPVCPVDCITMLARPQPMDEQQQGLSRKRAQARRSRLAPPLEQATVAPQAPTQQATIFAAALARSRAHKPL